MPQTEMHKGQEVKPSGLAIKKTTIADNSKQKLEDIENLSFNFTAEAESLPHIFILSSIPSISLTNNDTVGTGYLQGG